MTWAVEDSVNYMEVSFLLHAVLIVKFLKELKFIHRYRMWTTYVGLTPVLSLSCYPITVLCTTTGHVGPNSSLQHASALVRLLGLHWRATI
jgi:hypothetical protein